jgi:KDO2-lipid IV(A) lauroyltransferase
MAKPRSRAADFAVYLVVRFLVCFLQTVTPAFGRTIARGLAWLAYTVDRRHRKVAEDNLRQAFPGRFSEAELDRLVRGVYLHFCTFIAEMVHLPRKLWPHNWRRFVDNDESLAASVRALMADRPVLMVTGHFGNWELAGYALAMFGFKSFAVARPLDNPHLDRFLRQFRERTGQQLLAKRGELERMEAILRGNGIVCIVGDQDAGQRGQFVEFFGRPASTHKSIALLASEYNASVVVVGARRLGELRYHMHITDAFGTEDVANAPSPLRAITQRFTAALERLVRLDPSQYLWLHRRWKHQPQVRVRKAA